MAKLTVLINDKPGRIYRLVKKLTVGRDSVNDIQLLDQKVSRRHFAIEKKKGFYILKDLGSRNGTYLNEVRIESTELKPGDKIRAGNTCLAFGEEPYLDTVENLETGDLDISEHSDSDPVEYQYDPHKLKELADKITDRKDFNRIISQFSELIAFSGYNRPLDSSSILYQGIQDIVNELISIERVFIALRNTTTNQMETVAVRSSERTGQEPDFNDPVYRKVFIQGLSILSRNGFRKVDSDSDRSFAARQRTAMCVPIRHGVKILGLIFVDAPGGIDRFTSESLMMLSAIGGLAGVQIDALRLHKELQARALSSLLVVSELAEITSNNQHQSSIRRLTSQVKTITDCMGLPEEQVDLFTTCAFIASKLNELNPDAPITETLPEDGGEPDPREAIFIQQMELLPGLKETSRIVKHRKENFDGSGLPDGLSGNAIPLGSRVLRAILLLDELYEKNIDRLIEKLNHFNGTILDPIIIRALKQCGNRISESSWTQNTQVTLNDNQ